MTYLSHDRSRPFKEGSANDGWIHLAHPTEPEYAPLMRAYGLPKDAFTGVLDPYEVPRSERGAGPFHLFILRYPAPIAPGLYATRPMALILVQGKIITVIGSDDKAIRPFLLDKEDSLDTERVGAREELLLDVAYGICKAYIEAIHKINGRIRALESEIAASTKSKTMEELIHLSRSLILFKTATAENEPVLEAIFQLEAFRDCDDREALLHDVIIESRQSQIMARQASEMVEKLSDLYSNLISNNLNDVMKTLTSLTILMTVPTIIAGYWGMNTALPLEHRSGAFWLLLLVSGVIMLLLYFYLRRKDYL